MLGENGIVIVSCTLNRQTKEILAGPEILTRGFVYVKESGDLIKETQDICLETIQENIELDSKKVDYTKIKNDVREKLGKYFYKNDIRIFTEFTNDKFQGFPIVLILL